MQEFNSLLFHDFVADEQKQPTEIDRESNAKMQPMHAQERPQGMRFSINSIISNSLIFQEFNSLLSQF